MDQLTKRQEEIYQVYIEQPCQNLSSIAKNFGIALSTVKIHLGAAHKLGKPYRTKYKINDTIRLDFILMNGQIYLNTNPTQLIEEKRIIDDAIVYYLRNAPETRARPSKPKVSSRKARPSNGIESSLGI